MKLNQVLAIEKGEKNKTNDRLTKFYHDCQKPQLFSGIIKTYSPRDEEGEKLPPEQTVVQINAGTEFQAACETLEALIDITAKKDYTNCEAKADIVVNDKPLLTAVPVTHLLWLEKQLTDLHTNIKSLPVRDSSEQWLDMQDGIYRTAPALTLRTKKVPRSQVLYEATKEHPAQVQGYTEDVVIGEFRTTKLSGAYSAAQVRELSDRIEAVKKAVQIARETANISEVVNTPAIGKTLLDYIFAR